MALVVRALWSNVRALGAGWLARRGMVGKKRRRYMSHDFKTAGGTKSILLRMRINRFEPASAAVIWRSISCERVPFGSRASRT